MFKANISVREFFYRHNPEDIHKEIVIQDYYSLEVLDCIEFPKTAKELFLYALDKGNKTIIERAIVYQTGIDIEGESYEHRQVSEWLGVVY